MSVQNELIVALATANSVSALAVVRLSGENALSTVATLMGLPVDHFKKKKRAVGNFADVDYLVAIAWSSKKSYTGEEMVDLICHGSPETAVNVISKLESKGARIALPGEFTRRAWKNGKLTSYDVLALSAKYAHNSSGDNLDQLVKRLSLITTELEGFIEFGEDHEVGASNPIALLIKDAVSVVSTLIKKVESIELLPRVFLMGPVNAGKSTLFNILSGQEYAITSDTPGTTRDGLAKTITLSGRAVELNDSAGFGGFELDSRALSLVLSSLKNSDRIVWMDQFASEPPDALSKYDVLRVCTKSDLQTKTVDLPDWIYYSSLDNSGLDKIVSFIVAEESGSPSWRLRRILKLLHYSEEIYNTHDYALLAEVFADIHHEAEIPQRNGEAVERALDRFCVGK